MRHFPPGFARQTSFYGELAPWYPLLTPAHEYAGEANALQAMLGNAKRVLELGCGAGHLASHLVDVDLVLTDISPEMLALSKRLNTAVPHHLGDMRHLRLDQRFDAVFAHDAVCYLHSEADLAALAKTAAAHLSPGGVFIALPDYVAETLNAGVDDGGEDGPSGDGLRYLEWLTPDPEGPLYSVHYALMVRDSTGRVEVYKDHHREAAHPTAAWVYALEQAGLAVEVLNDEWREVVFRGTRL
ncbi:MAG: trans-aconitate 2-methyltransferase [Myxococcota bacterium]